MMFHLESLKITTEILNLIAEIDEFKGAWQAMGKIAPERLSQLKKVATIESIGSSTRIEGVKLSNKEIEKLLKGTDTNTFSSRDEEEVAGYAKAMDLVFDSWQSIPINESSIKHLHSVLLTYSGKDQRHKGNYKTQDNTIEAFDADGKSLGVVMQTTPPFETPMKMENLIAWVNDSLDERTLHPLLVVSIFVVAFLAIHPFNDGNGRLSRVLTTLILLKLGYEYVPFSSLESVIEESKDGYYLSLQRTQSSLFGENPDWNPWIVFFLRSLKRQKSRLEYKVKREKLMQRSYTPLATAILELAHDHGRVTISDIVNATGGNRNTIKNNLKELVHDGVLELHGRGKNSWYTLS